MIAVIKMRDNGGGRQEGKHTELTNTLDFKFSKLSDR